MKFLLDMPISPKTEKFLRGLGYDAIRVDKLGMKKATDKEIFEYAIKEDRTIITVDLDFGRILSYFKTSKPSIIIFRLKYPSVEKINRLLSSIIPKIEEEIEKGSIIVIGDEKVRVKNLPIE